MIKKKFPGKTYRKIIIGENEYVGKDGYKNRIPNYIVSGFEKNFFYGKKVLDIGCASGAILFMLAQQKVKYAIGIEVDKVKLDIGKKIQSIHNFNQIKFYEMDAFTYFHSHFEKFDCIFLLNILHHLPDPYTILDYVANLCEDVICMEMPINAWYTPYPRDKSKKKFFNKPVGASDVINHLKSLFFYLHTVNESENQENFIGETRKVYIFKKYKIPYCSISDIVINEPQLIIGPGASGKTTLLEKLGIKNKGESGGPFKFSDDGSYNKKTWKTIIKRLTGQSVEKVFQSFNSQKPILYLNPNYQNKLRDRSIRGIQLNIDAWLAVIQRQKCKVIVCYVDKKILKERLLERLRSRYLKDLIPLDKINTIVEILTDHNLSNKIAENKINKLSDKNFRQIKNICKYQFYSNYIFSYERLFAVLKDKKIPYRVIVCSD